ncbi:MAG: hypothetical protein HQ485_09505 [Acidobacteria bacterium]|nr:hypothetical protein [Acidobacteriota bacterium]
MLLTCGIDPQRHFSNCAAVWTTKRRLTALLLVPRLVSASPIGSKLRAYCRVVTPTSICSTMRRFNGSVWAIAWNVGSATSWPTALATVPARGAGCCDSCA